MRKNETQSLLQMKKDMFLNYEKGEGIFGDRKLESSIIYLDAMKDSLYLVHMQVKNNDIGISTE